jgi:curved DNA-binding protein CbpA
MTDDLPQDLYYERLQVGRGASRDEIVHAYRRLAHGAHPDTQPEDPAAARRFREITEAYEVLGDPTRRALYDRTRGARHGVTIAPVSPAAGRPHSPLDGCEVASEVPSRRFGATSRAGAPPLVAGPVRVEQHRGDPAEGQLARGGYAERGLLWAVSEMFDSFWRR